MVADRAQGKTYPERFEALGLQERTRYMPLGSPRDILRGLCPYLLPFTRSGRHAYKGLVRILSSPHWKTLSFRRRMKALVQSRLLVEDSFDLLHAHYLIGAYEFLPVARFLNIPLLTTFHGLPVKETGPELGGEKAAELFHAGSLFLINTRFAQRQLIGLGCPEEKTRILPQGLRLVDFPYCPRPHPKEGPIILLTVARLSHEKGHRFAIEAVKKLRQRWPQLEYRLVGTGPEKAEIERLILESGLKDCVHLRGELTDEGLRKEYEGAHIFILPSIHDRSGSFHTETQGVVIQEAQASGVITVASRTGGIPECMDDGKAGFLVQPESSAELADKITWLLDHPNQWEAWQRAGRAWVENHYAMEKIGKCLWDIYQELSRAKSPRGGRDNLLRANLDGTTGPEGSG